MPEPVLPLDPDGKDFAELVAVKSIDENTFRSIAKPCPNVPKPINGIMHYTTFGGHLYAQSAWAAAQTVGEGFIIHVCIHPSIHRSATLLDIPYDVL